MGDWYSNDERTAGIVNRYDVFDDRYDDYSPDDDPGMSDADFKRLLDAGELVPLDDHLEGMYDDRYEDWDDYDIPFNVYDFDKWDDE